MLLAPSAEPRPASGRLASALTFEVNVLTPVVATLEPVPSLPSTSARTARRATGRVTASAPAARAGGPSAPTPEPESSAELEPPALTADRLPLDLSPLAAARSLGPDTPESWPIEARPSSEPAAREEARLAEGIPGLARDRRASDRSPGEIAQDLQGAALRPWDLILQPLKRGRYRYRGQGFDAVIATDGSVKYRDKDGLRLSLSQRQMLQESKGGRHRGRNPNLPVFGLDLGDPSAWVDKIMGKDPHAAERRTFLERTRALRNYLRDQAARRVRETHHAPAFTD